MRRNIPISLIILILTVGCAQALFAKQPVLSPELDTALTNAKMNDEFSVIVRFKNSPNITAITAAVPETDAAKSVIDTLKTTANASERAIEAVLDSGAVKDRKTLWIINGMAVKANPATLKKLADDPTVESIVPDKKIRLPKNEKIEKFTADPGKIPPGQAKKPDGSVSPQSGGGGGYGTPEWNIGMVHADDLWSMGYTGQGVVVATMDTGVDAVHADLSGRWRGGSTGWYDPNGQHATPYDVSGHGTAVLSLILGGDATGSAIGVAPGAQWISVKIFNDAGEASYSAIHDGFQWLLDPDGNSNTNDMPHVVNNSWALEDAVDMCIEEFRSDIQILKSAGIAVVFAAGNAGPGGATSLSPACNLEGYAVGSVDNGKVIALSSSRGVGACEGDTYPEVTAPGVNVRTADLTFGFWTTAYAYAEGTSFAAPHVTGAMALLLSADANLTVAELESVLLQTPEDLGATGPDDEYGYGLIDALAAYHSLGGSPTCTDADSDGFYLESGCGVDVDCDDADPTVYPGATEIPDDGIDQDCDGFDLILCVDEDNDGFYAAENCGSDVDCDDTDPTIHPGATEIPDDGIDQDCDGFDLILCVDADNDGYFAGLDCGTAVDCDDADPTVHPGAAEINGDGIDQDCNGYDLTIDITRAIYRTAQDKVVVLTTSNLAENADLAAEIPGIGAVNMRWNADLTRWQKTVAGAISKGFDPANPGSVVVSGPEGSAEAPIVIKP